MSLVTDFKNYFNTNFRIISLLCNPSTLSHGIKINVLRRVVYISHQDSHNRIMNLLRASLTRVLEQTQSGTFTPLTGSRVGLCAHMGTLANGKGKRTTKCGKTSEMGLKVQLKL